MENRQFCDKPPLGKLSCVNRRMRDVVMESKKYKDEKFHSSPLGKHCLKVMKAEQKYQLSMKAFTQNPESPFKLLEMQKNLEEMSQLHNTNLRNLNVLAP